MDFMGFTAIIFFGFSPFLPVSLPLKVRDYSAIILLSHGKSCINPPRRLHPWISSDYSSKDSWPMLSSGFLPFFHPWWGLSIYLKNSPAFL